MGWNTNDKSEALGITQRHVLRLVQTGILPKTDDPKQITNAYINHSKESKGGKADLIEERTRLIRIQADKRELELKIAQGELIHVDTAMQLWGQVVQSVRSKLLAIPTKLAPLVLGCKGLSEIKDTVEKQIYEVMEELKNPKLKTDKKSMGAHSTDMADHKTADKTHHLRMGRQTKSSKPRVIGRKGQVVHSQG